MTDVLRIALDRRDRLSNEVDKLDEFIRMAEELITVGPFRDLPESNGSAARQSDGTHHRTDEAEGANGPSSRMNILRRTVANG